MLGVIFNANFIIFRSFLLELLNRLTRPELTLILPTIERKWEGRGKYPAEEFRTERLACVEKKVTGISIRLLMLIKNMHISFIVSVTSTSFGCKLLTAIIIPSASVNTYPGHFKAATESHPSPPGLLSAKHAEFEETGRQEVSSPIRWHLDLLRMLA